MSYSIRFEKQDDGTYLADLSGVTSADDRFPDAIWVQGHREDGKNVDVTVRVDDLIASASSRKFQV